MKTKEAANKPTHTPGTGCSNGFNPGQCGVNWRGANLKAIVFCPLHAAAPDLLAALNDAAALLRTLADNPKDARNMVPYIEKRAKEARAAILRATEGK